MPCTGADARALDGMARRGGCSAAAKIGPAGRQRQSQIGVNARVDLGAGRGVARARTAAVRQHRCCGRPGSGRQAATAPDRAQAAAPGRGCRTAYPAARRRHGRTAKAAGSHRAHRTARGQARRRGRTVRPAAPGPALTRAPGLAPRTARRVARAHRRDQDAPWAGSRPVPGAALCYGPRTARLQWPPHHRRHPAIPAAAGGRRARSAAVARCCRHDAAAAAASPRGPGPHALQECARLDRGPGSCCGWARGTCQRTHRRCHAAALLDCSLNPASPPAAAAHRRCPASRAAAANRRRPVRRAEAEHRQCPACRA
eukprot:37543-Chlamydomonas_euryale.AAC.1